MSALTEREAAAVSDALRAIAECLRHLACGYGLDPRERAACLTLLAAGIPGVDSTDLQTVRKVLGQSAHRRLSVRARDRASQLSVKLAERAEALSQTESRFPLSG